jgi:hypothetical protein
VRRPLAIFLAALGAVAFLLGVWELAWSFVLDTNIPFGWAEVTTLRTNLYGPSAWAGLLGSWFVFAGVGIVAGLLGDRRGRENFDRGRMLRTNPVVVVVITLVVALAQAFVVLSGDGNAYAFPRIADTSPRVEFLPGAPIAELVLVVAVAVGVALFCWWIGEQLGRSRARAVSRPLQA